MRTSRTHEIVLSVSTGKLTAMTVGHLREFMAELDRVGMPNETELRALYGSGWRVLGMSAHHKETILAATTPSTDLTPNP